MRRKSAGGGECGVSRKGTVRGERVWCEEVECRGRSVV